MPAALESFLVGVPLEWALPAAFASFLLLAGLVWCVPRSSVYEGAPDPAPWRDLRIWASALIAIQLGIYLIT